MSSLIIDILVSCYNYSAAQSGLKCIIQMLQKKKRNNYKKLKIERQMQFLKKEVLLSVCFPIQGKEKQKLHFTSVNANNENV